MMRHLHAMYGLVKLPLSTSDEFETLDRMTRETLGEVAFRPRDDGTIEAQVMRKALVAVGEKRDRNG